MRTFDIDKRVRDVLIFGQLVDLNYLWLIGDIQIQVHPNLPRSEASMMLCFINDRKFQITIQVEQIPELKEIFYQEYISRDPRGPDGERAILWGYYSPPRYKEDDDADATPKEKELGQLLYAEMEKLRDRIVMLKNCNGLSEIVSLTEGLDPPIC